MSIMTRALGAEEEEEEEAALVAVSEKKESPRRRLRRRRADSFDGLSTRKIMGVAVVVTFLVTVMVMGLVVALIILPYYSSNNNNQSTHACDANANVDNPTTQNEQHQRDEEIAFEIAQRRFQSRLDASSEYDAGFTDLMEYPIQPLQPHKPDKILNSIRIPKGGSSSLSVIARALAGCHPDGYPCCVYPGNPFGSCPRQGLECKNITGCMGHSPVLEGNDEPVITSLRNPEDRLLSGFFYTPPHRPKEPKHDKWSFHTFVNYYTMQPKYRNVMTKMLSGDYAYKNFDRRVHTLQKAKRNLCRAAWFGMVDQPILSSLLVYESPAFAYLIPNPVVFALPATDNDDDNTIADVDHQRANTNYEYALFKTVTYVNNNGTDVFRKYNQQDLHLYSFAQHLFCMKAEMTGILKEAHDANIATNEIQFCREILIHKAASTTTIEDLCPPPPSLHDFTTTTTITTAAAAEEEEEPLP